MSLSVIVVESPAKAKTLKKYLESKTEKFEVLASYGHVRDLIPKEGAVNPETFEMKYQLIDKNKKHVDAICHALKNADQLYLATDPDREGEAISWHLYEIIKQNKKLAKKPVKRVAFFEITKSAVREAIANPRTLSMDLVNAQQARRALDYLVGFNLSPLLWKKIRRGLSAGRVQSPALRMIVEREQAIQAFESKEYWSIEADCKKNKNFVAKLVEYNGEKLKQFSIDNGDSAQDVEQALNKLSKGKLKVVKITRTKRKRNPAAPFTTSTMQQEAIRKLGFSAQRAMRVAQQLYEGVDIGDGAVGLISYMRTDSVNLSQEALKDIRSYIQKNYTKEDLPQKARHFKTRSKNAQEAHEAIRPTMIVATPSSIKDKLSNEQYKLYSLIWKRTVASQMEHAVINLESINLACGNEQNLFRATGSTIASAGFMKVYQEGLDDSADPDAESLLPALEEGQEVELLKIRSEQHFTEPPPRFSEASLVKTLEEHGIGRPSTYASIISTLVNRTYVTLDNKRFVPTDVGSIVNKFLTNYFTQYVDYDFTAKLEDSLDEVARGERQWKPLLLDFWQPFAHMVKHIDTSIQRKDVTQEATDETCPDCGDALSIRLGKRGRFVGCNGYPECKYTRSLDEDKETAAAVKEEIEGRNCPNCEATLLLRNGKYGKFIGCSNYPKCKFIEPLEKPEEYDIPCPQCKKGKFIKRKSRYGTFFYACDQYPSCKHAMKHAPINESCPQCNWPVLMHKVTKRDGDVKVCPQKECGFSEPLPEKANS